MPILLSFFLLFVAALGFLASWLGMKLIRRLQRIDAACETFYDSRPFPAGEAIVFVILAVTFAVSLFCLLYYVSQPYQALSIWSLLWLPCLVGLQAMYCSAIGRTSPEAAGEAVSVLLGLALLVLLASAGIVVFILALFARRDAIHQERMDFFNQLQLKHDLRQINGPF